ncbi:arylesterase [Pseudorhodoplanes sp.]|uniref:arylesterase n=1 Tax=Pseudorhodoplanes sp. TaxID=1934341 RepID=UPI002C067DA8|nr:arylesterase [Pseudorhodoplanes sp.]HWV43105.1 arylesterase [Pseudorhodoplanes sp.]
MQALVHRLTVALLMLTGLVASTTSPAAAQDGTPLKIVAFGDSLTAGYGLPAQDAFPAKLQAALKAKGHNVEIENAGVSGDTASGGLSRLDWSIPDGTDAVIVELGANDMLRGVDPQVTRQALDEILARLTARNIAVLFCGMRAAPNMGADFARAFESIFAELAKKYDVIFYPFFLDGVAAQAKLALRDGVHPNAAGVDIIVANIVPKAEELIARARKRAPS